MCKKMASALKLRPIQIIFFSTITVEHYSARRVRLTVRIDVPKLIVQVEETVETPFDSGNGTVSG